MKNLFMKQTLELAKMNQGQRPLYVNIEGVSFNKVNQQSPYYLVQKGNQYVGIDFLAEMSGTDRLPGGRGMREYLNYAWDNFKLYAPSLTKLNKVVEAYKRLQQLNITQQEFNIAHTKLNVILNNVLRELFITIDRDTQVPVDRTEFNNILNELDNI